MANSIPPLPPPLPLRRAMRIDYTWGVQKFEIIATAASIRTVHWEKTGRDVTWLHCKAIQTMAIKPEGENHLMMVLIPAEYITLAEPAGTFRITRSHSSGDLGIFPPIHPPPANAIPLAELERVIASLLDPSLN